MMEVLPVEPDQSKEATVLPHHQLGGDCLVPVEGADPNQLPRLPLGPINRLPPAPTSLRNPLLVARAEATQGAGI